MKIKAKNTHLPIIKSNPSFVIWTPDKLLTTYEVSLLMIHRNIQLFGRCLSPCHIDFRLLLIGHRLLRLDGLIRRLLLRYQSPYEPSTFNSNNSWVPFAMQIIVSLSNLIWFSLFLNDTALLIAHYHHPHYLVFNRDCGLIIF